MANFNYNNYRKNNPLLKEEVYEDELSNYLDSAVQKCNAGGGNGENLVQYGLPEVASMIDSYMMTGVRGEGEDGFYTETTVNAFKKFVDSMVKDEILNNNKSEYDGGDDYDNFTHTVNDIKEGYSINIKGDRIKGSGDLNPDVEVMLSPDGVKISQKINNRNSIILLSNKQAKELKNNL